MRTPRRNALPDWSRRNGPRILRVGLGVVFLWFGVLKFFLLAILIVIGIAIAPVALVLLFLFGIPILLVMGMVGLGAALATG